ncbi:methyltransferase domain-containing protein [Haliscomenobacter sp.]|uniref:methyltransferase domain-containing protein n=1 Tax=Haliscomenobacter sp. TaxID=2717303 RepID=UPI0035941156
MFKQRSLKKELLDAEDIPTADLYQNLRELDRINTLLGGYDITFSALKKVIQPEKAYILIDIGCGGGDTLKRIQQWQLRKKLELQLMGIDLKSVCIEYATQHKARPDIQFICDDYRNMFRHVPQIDIIHACLFCHHLDEQQLIELIQFALKKNTVLIINDLERNWFAYWSIKILTAFFSKSYLVKNDAPLSVARGFVKKEWLAIIKKAGAKHFSVKNKWAFRHEVIIYGTGQ